MRHGSVLIAGRHGSPRGLFGLHFTALALIHSPCGLRRKTATRIAASGRF